MVHIPRNYSYNDCQSAAAIKTNSKVCEKVEERDIYPTVASLKYVLGEQIG
jgi:hypothetical protein